MQLLELTSSYEYAAGVSTVLTTLEYNDMIDPIQLQIDDRPGFVCGLIMKGGTVIVSKSQRNIIFALQDAGMDVPGIISQRSGVCIQ